MYIYCCCFKSLRNIEPLYNDSISQKSLFLTDTKYCSVKGATKYSSRIIPELCELG